MKQSAHFRHESPCPTFNNKRELENKNAEIYEEGPPQTERKSTEKYWYIVKFLVNIMKRIDLWES
jgi:hypothetical protein